MAIYKDNVPGFPGYHVTRSGKVYSLKCKHGQRAKAYLLTPRMSTNGYYRIGLYKDGKKYEKRLNRLVAEVYLPNLHNYPFVCHKDGNPENNQVDNLYWGTIEMNTQDRDNLNATRTILYKRSKLHNQMLEDSAFYLRSKGYTWKDIRLCLQIGRTRLVNIVSKFKEQNHGEKTTQVK